MDEDGDGFGRATDTDCQEGLLPGDCDDSDKDVHPDAHDLCGNDNDDDCDGTIDEGIDELCNGLDDDCDGETDEGVLSGFYRDADGDGAGQGQPIYACIAPGGTSEVSTDCDDEDAHRSPSEPEVCDGLDNDCSGAADQTFACAMGTQTDCITHCGSAGTGACTSSCEKPLAADCAPPAEVCNGADDNCDGSIDEGLRGKAEDETVWTQSVPGSSALGMAFGVPRQGGGAFIFYDGRGDGSGIQVGALDQDGRAVASPASLADITAGARFFRAIRTETSLVLASAVSAGGSTFNTRVQIFHPETLSLVDEETVLNSGLIYDASAFEDVDGLHVLILYGRYVEPSTRLFARVLTRGQSGFLPTSDERELANGYMQNAATSPIPCRSEWLVAINTNPPVLRRITAGGALVGPNPVATLEGPATGLSSRASKCASQDPELVVAMASTGATTLRRLRFTRSSGIMSQVGVDLSLATRFSAVSMLDYGGRFFIAASETVAEMYEVDFAAAQGSQLRSIELRGPSDPHPGRTDWAPFPTLSIVPTGRGLGVTFGSMPEYNTLNAHYAETHPEDPKKPVGLTFSVGCP